MKSEKLQKVEEFMRTMSSKISGSESESYSRKILNKPGEPIKSIKELRAKLIFEECMETIQALGVSVYVDKESRLNDVAMAGFDFVADRDFNIVEVADGLADIEVIALGTYLSCGIDDVEIFNEVHRTNMLKFPEGYNGLRSDGKWVKPLDWKEPDIKSVLENQFVEM